MVSVSDLSDQEDLPPGYGLTLPHQCAPIPSPAVQVGRMVQASATRATQQARYQGNGLTPQPAVPPAAAAAAREQVGRQVLWHSRPALPHSTPPLTPLKVRSSITLALEVASLF